MPVPDNVGLSLFGKLTKDGIEANVGPAQDAALAGEDYYAGQPDLWSVESYVEGRDEAYPRAHVVIRVYAG